jgi:hypothetical protein
MEYLSTRDAAEVLGVETSTLSKAVWNRRLREPERGPGGCFIWTREDLERAAWLLRHKDLDAILSERGKGFPHD